MCTNKMPWIWLLAFLAAETCLEAFAQDGPLPLRLGGGDFLDGRVSERRQRLVQLLAELIERHGPLGVWTHADDDVTGAFRGGSRRPSAARLGGYDLWDGSDSDEDSRPSVTSNRDVFSRVGSGGSAFRANVESYKSASRDISDGRAEVSDRRAGSSTRELGSKKILSGLYQEPVTLSTPRGDGGIRSRDDGGPIRFSGGDDRTGLNNDDSKRRGGGTRRGNIVRVTARRRNGVAIGNSPLQPGEDCEDEERTNYYEPDSSVDDQESSPFKPSTRDRNRTPGGPVSPSGRPKGNKQNTTPTKVYRPTTVRPRIRYPSENLEPPFTAATSSPTANTDSSTSDTTATVAGSEVVPHLIKTWQDETKEYRQKMMLKIPPSKEYDSDSYFEYDDSVPSERIPETPRWDGSLRVRGVLSAGVAGYNEPYTMWYNGDTDESRFEFNDGTASSLRLRTPNGSFRLLSTELMEFPEGRKRMCRMGTGAVLSAKESGPPAFPNMKAFKFAGLMDGANKIEYGASPGDRRVERWQNVVRVKERASEHQPDGEEHLTYRHEMIVARRPHGVVPLRYSVMVDSSVLGAASDVYMHVYHEFEEIAPPQEQLNFNFEAECDVREEANVSDPEDRAALEPLREFTEETRGPLYRVLLVRYKTRFVRQYSNYDEEILRKNILMQNTRFVASVNRRAERFRLEVNFLADRLSAEVAQLYGAQPYQQEGKAVAPPADFPYERPMLRRRVRKLPRAFDWREKGAVNPVEFQGTRCMSCWAFAVVGAIEGALFKRTGRKMAFSKQALVDCGKKTHANGCSGTWPKYAYEYVRRYGLPTNSSYKAYIEQNSTCEAKGLSPLVYISGHVDVPHHSVNALKIAIYENGPVVVIIDAKSKYFRMYKTGVLGDTECGKRLRDTNHAVLAVGWGEDDGKTYFIIKNSWSESWGESGYAKMDGTNNICAILTQPSYPLLPRLEDDTETNSSSEDEYLR